MASILTNGTGMYIMSKAESARNSQTASQMQLASGLKSPNPAGDPSGNSISAKLKADISAAKILQSMALQGSALVSLAATNISNTSNMINRMMELAMQATATTIADSERVMIQSEISQLLSQLDSNAQVQFAGRTLFDGNYTGEIKIGLLETDKLDVSLLNLTVEGLGLNEVDVTSSENASAAVGLLKNALNTVLNHSADVSAIKSRLDVVDQNMNAAIQKYEEALSTYNDADVVDSLASEQGSKVVSESAVAALQSNIKTLASIGNLIQQTMR